MKIKCMIIEDEPKAMMLLEDHISKIPYLHYLGGFVNPRKAQEFWEENAVDLVFLDINLPAKNGINVAQDLPEDIKIIFITAHSEYAVTSYELEAVDYLLKPVPFERFARSIEKAKVLFQRSGRQDYFYLKSGKKMVKLFWRNILYIKGMREYVSFVTIKGQTLGYKRMSEVEKIAPPHFFRVHHSWIINLEKIQSIESNKVIINQESIPVSRRNEKAFKAQLDKYRV